MPESKNLQRLTKPEKLRNARLCNNDKSTIHLPRQYLPQPHGGICDEGLSGKGRAFRVTRHVLAPAPEAFITEPVILAQRWKDLRTEPHGKRLP